MSYFVNHLMGNASVEFSLDSLPSLYEELSKADGEHSDVSLTHESEWCLAAFSSGLVTWENLAGEGEPKHMRDVPQDKVLALWSLLSEGKVSEIDSENWLAGYG
ncbi:hypothetical protein [Pelagibius sp. Alg239-R121]|uniref:hypothetical protein n=1 Tax=Pelagibius sp. Alg239-R121 TaxID=2993448 RepID=UPI0024A6FCE3|nr:hypothetical protein [Pelagibius sp. Alg239-R121]